MVVDIHKNDGWDYLFARMSRPPPTHYFHLGWDGQVEEIGAPQEDDRSDEEKMVSLGGGQMVSLAKLQEIFHQSGEFDGNSDGKSSEESGRDGNSEEAAGHTLQVQWKSAA